MSDEKVYDEHEMRLATIQAETRVLAAAARHILAHPVNDRDDGRPAWERIGNWLLAMSENSGLRWNVFNGDKRPFSGPEEPRR
jgi:hypothetical protein